MILTCPACTTRYAIDPASLGAGGRKVRCVKCQHVWHQAPPEDMPRRVELTTEPVLAGAGVAPDRVVLPPRPRQRAAESTGLGFGLLVFLVVLFGLVAAVGYLGRERIVEEWPAARDIYALVGLETAGLGEGLELSNINFVRQTVDNQDILTVEGDILNTTQDVVGVPNLIATLRNEKNQWLFDWVFRIDRAALQPGESAHFATTTKNPPEESKRITITFTEKPVGG
jgi:predicted Zn finger-like uncharacterized protein